MKHLALMRADAEAVPNRTDLGAIDAIAVPFADVPGVDAVPRPNTVTAANTTTSTITTTTSAPSTYEATTSSAIATTSTTTTTTTPSAAATFSARMKLPLKNVRDMLRETARDNWSKYFLSVAHDWMLILAF